MKFSYSEVWADTLGILRGNVSLLLAVAGAFLFLPPLLIAQLAPFQTTGGEAPTVEAVTAYYRANFVLVLLGLTINFVGNLVILVMALDEDRPTVAGAIRQALKLLWRYFTMSLVTGLVISLAMIPSLVLLGLSDPGRPNAGAFFGAMALLVPALYLAARMGVASAVIAAEPRSGAIEAIRSSWVLTAGAAWAILGLLVILLAVFGIINFAVIAVFGSLLRLLDLAAGGEGAGAFLLLILQTALGAGFNTLLFVLLAAIYRRLSGKQPAASGI